MCAGGIHDSGSRPIINSSRRCRASAQSVFARFFLPSTRPSPPARPDAPRRRPGAAPRPRTASPSSPPTRPPAPDPRTGSRNRRTAARSAGATRARDSSPGHRLDPLRRDLRSMLIQAHHDRHRHPSFSSNLTREQRSARPSKYREPRSVLPIRMAGRAAGTARAFDLCHSTRRAGHLHRPLHVSCSCQSRIPVSRSSPSLWRLTSGPPSPARAIATPRTHSSRVGRPDDRLRVEASREPLRASTRRQAAVPRLRRARLVSTSDDGPSWLCLWRRRVVEPGDRSRDWFATKGLAGSALCRRDALGDN